MILLASLSLLLSSIELWLTVIVLIIFHRWWNAIPSKLPPSPPSLPFLGHLPLLGMTKDPPALLNALSKKYGAIYHLKLGKQIAIVISSEKLAKETLVKKGKTYAGRWAGKVLMYNSNQGADLAMAPYGEHWRKLRRTAHQILTPAALTSMDAILEAEAIRLLQSIVQRNGEPLEIKKLFLRFTCNIILSKSMGITFEGENDDNFIMICDAMQKIFELAGVGGLEDYFEGAIFEWIEKRKISALKPYKERLHEGFIRNRIAALKHYLDSEGLGGRVPCYAEELISHMEEDGLTINDIEILMVDFLLAGMDTTSTTLDWIFVHLANQKELQEKAYEEIFKATDQGKHLTTFEHISGMPYVQSIIKETLRLHPPGPLGLPRMTIEEDVIDEYVIPKGSQVIYNIPGIHASIFKEETQLFQPERFLKETTSSKENTFLENIYSFGQGRRICPGSQLAFREMYLVVSNILLLFSIENHKPGQISLESTFGLTVSPKENLKLRFFLRNPEIGNILTKNNN